MKAIAASSVVAVGAGASPPSVPGGSRRTGGRPDAGTPQDRIAASRGIVRAARRPPGWVAPGPRPAGAGDRADGWPAADEDLCHLSGDWRIFQKLRGHRFSLDDLVTAWFALEHANVDDVRTALDLGCGSGSVLSMIAWARPAARVIGIEAQAVSAGLARRSIAWNGCDDRCEVRHGDLRDRSLVAEGAVFDLVTGTPPYIPLGDGVVSERVQRGPACFEIRGGVEDYVAAAARWLAPRGVFAICHSDAARTVRAAAAEHLVVRARRPVVPREGREPLFWVFAMQHRDRATHDGARDALASPALVVRDRGGQWAADFRALRESMGMPCLPR